MVGARLAEVMDAFKVGRRFDRCLRCLWRSAAEGSEVGEESRGESFLRLVVCDFEVGANFTMFERFCSQVAFERSRLESGLERANQP